MLDRRLRRRANINPAQGQRLAWTGVSLSHKRNGRIKLVYLQVPVSFRKCKQTRYANADSTLGRRLLNIEPTLVKRVVLAEI